MLVLVRGSGDVGSAVAHALYRAGHKVVLHDSPKPAHSRRAMAFVDALYNGVTELDGVLAKRPNSIADVAKMLQCGRAVPIIDEPLEKLMTEVRPEVLVDARMRKREQPEMQRGLARLTIGLGPNFEAGVNTDVAIETMWGDELGAVLWSGRTHNLEGEPQTIAGHARDRYVYAPLGGTFKTSLSIGDLVTEDQELARIGDAVLRAPLAGCLRGLTYDGAVVAQKAKVIEVDPRGGIEAAPRIWEHPQHLAPRVFEGIGPKHG